MCLPPQYDSYTIPAIVRFKFHKAKSRQLRIGWVDARLYTLVFEERVDDEGEYYHFVTLWRSTIAERQKYEENDVDFSRGRTGWNANPNRPGRESGMGCGGQSFDGRGRGGGDCQCCGYARELFRRLLWLQPIGMQRELSLQLLPATSGLLSPAGGLRSARLLCTARGGLSL